VILAVVALCLIGGAIAVKPDVGAMVKGALAFDIPRQVDPSGVALVVTCSIPP
jgi:hypothetical protein